ncbi:MAG: CHAT domain-containing tetratricopeptide repeat protein [Bacteroidota bacterium]
MLRLYILTILLAAACQSLFAQTVHEIQLLIDETDPSKYKVYFNAAREDGDSAKVFVIKNLLGNTLIGNHRYYEAEKLLLENVVQLQKTHFNKTKFGNVLSVYDCYDYLGKLYIETGNYRKANSYLNQAYRLKSASLTKQSVSRIENTRNLCVYHLSKEQYDSAYRYLRLLKKEMVRTRESSRYLNDLFFAYYKEMSEVMLSQGDMRRANNYYKKALKVYKPIRFGSSIPDAELQLLKSRILLRRGDLDGSLRLSSTLNQEGVDSLKLYPESLRLRIVAAYEMHDFEKAFQVGKQLMQIDLSNVRKVFSDLTEDEKSEFNKNVHFDFSLLVSVLESIDNPLKRDQYERDLLEFRIQTKGLLLEHTQQLQNYYKTATGVAQERYKQLQSLKLRHASALIKDEVQLVATLSDSIELVERTLSAEMHRAGTSAPIAIGTIMNELGRDEMAIEIIQFQKFSSTPDAKNTKLNRYGLSSSSAYLAFFIDREKISTVFIDNGDHLDGRAAKYYRNSIVDAGTIKDSLVTEFFWKPLSNHIGNKHKIFFSSDGVYSKINLNVLYEHGKYLIDEYDFIYLTNLKDILKPSVPLLATAGNATLIGWANFNSKAGADRSSIASSLKELHKTEFNDLPGTGDEITSVQSILQQAGWTTQTLTRENANERMVKSVVNPTILHIATHGFFIEENTDSDPMLQTGLVFTGVDIPGAPINDDGILTAYETTALQLDKTSLVILSACETGLGVVTSGEGVYGLQRAFEIAGARNIIMSFWKVDDRATQLLMTGFYQNLIAGKNIQQAFEAAQIDLRKEFPAPQDWGAFILLGK